MGWTPRYSLESAVTFSRKCILAALVASFFSTIATEVSSLVQIDKLAVRLGSVPESFSPRSFNSESEQASILRKQATSGCAAYSLAKTRDRGSQVQHWG